MNRYKVCGWEKFQHYKQRTPPWIKLHRSLLDDCEFIKSPVASRAIAPLLWLLASETSDATFTGDHEAIAFRLRIGKREVDEGIKGLLAIGYIECYSAASTTVLPCKQDNALETEESRVEKEAEAEKRKIAETDFIAWFDRVWAAFGKYGKKPQAMKYARAYSQADRELIESAIPEYLKCVTAGRMKMQMDGWLNPEKRAWDQDWIAATKLQVENDAKKRGVYRPPSKTTDEDLWK